MRKIKLPKHWTAREARATYEFLDDLKQLIYARYGGKIEKLCREEDFKGVDPIKKTDDDRLDGELPNR